MKLRKTPISKRTTYTYFFANGDKVILEPGKSTTIYASGGRTIQVDASITEMTITELHRNDDAEVRANLKYINCEDHQERQSRIANKKKWVLEHPDEMNPYEKPKRIINLDAFCDDEKSQGDKSRLLYQASVKAKQENADAYTKKLKIIREYVTTLPKSMQEMYDLIYIQGLKQSEVCKKLGLSKSTVSERVKTLNKKIKKHFSENPELLR
jgi:RNA polymerase sigma factor (sigma-70 family)